MTNEFFMFFDNKGLPIAVFMAADLERAIELFTKLYRKDWSECENDGISARKESDLSLHEWNMIAEKLKLPSCEIKLSQEKEACTYRLIQAAAMKHARDAYLETKKNKKENNSWGAIFS